MSDPPHVKEGDRASASHYNSVIDMARGAANQLPSSTIAARVGGAGGTTLSGSSKTLVRVFELTEDIQYPNAQTPPVGWPTLPDVPYAENCKAVWLDQSANTYGITDSLLETVYFPTDVDFTPADDPAITAGDRVRAVWDAQAGRWHADVPTTAEVPEDPTATVILCLVNQSTVSANNDPFDVDTVTVVSPFGGSTPTVTSVVNMLGVPSIEDKLCVAFLQSGTWYGIPGLDLQTVSAVTEVDYTPGPTSKFEAKTTDSVVFSKAAESSFVPWHDMIEETVVVSVDKSGTALRYQTEKMWTPEALDSVANATWETLTTVDPITDLQYDGSPSPGTFDMKKTQDVQVFSSNGSGAVWPEDANFNVQSPWHTTVLVTNIVRDIRLDGDDLEQHRYTANMLETLTDTGWDVWHATASC